MINLNIGSMSFSTNVLTFSVLVLLLSGCRVYDPPNPGPSVIYNCSDQAIYVYHSKNGKLELEPRLELFEKKKMEFMFKNTGCEYLFQSPNYRVNAYEEKEVQNPNLGLGRHPHDSLFFYFFSEKTMTRSSWEYIVNNQLYERRLSISIEEYNALHRVVTYTPPLK